LFETVFVKRNFGKTSSGFSDWIPARLIVLSRGEWLQPQLSGAAIFNFEIR
jgi:hypothetical protein